MLMRDRTRFGGYNNYFNHIIKRQLAIILLPINKLVETRCDYLHIALGYRTPIQSQEDYYNKSENTLQNVA